MAIELKKKQSISLTKASPGLRTIMAGLGWDANTGNGPAADCDVSALMLDANNKIPADGYFVFYNNVQSEDTAVQHKGDNRDGAGEGDDESIDIDLSKVNASIVQIVFTVTIHEAEARGHHFGNVTNAFIRICNKADNTQLCRFTLSDQYAGADSLMIGRLYRSENGWDFEAMGDAFGGGLGALVELYS